MRIKELDWPINYPNAKQFNVVLRSKMFNTKELEDLDPLEDVKLSDPMLGVSKELYIKTAQKFCPKLIKTAGPRFQEEKRKLCDDFLKKGIDGAYSRAKVNLVIPEAKVVVFYGTEAIYDNFEVPDVCKIESLRAAGWHILSVGCKYEYGKEEKDYEPISFIRAYYELESK